MTKACQIVVLACILDLLACSSSQQTATFGVSNLAFLSGQVTVYDFSTGALGKEYESFSLETDTVLADGLNANGGEIPLDLNSIDTPVRIQLKKAVFRDYATQQTLAFDSSDTWEVVLPQLTEAQVIRITPFTTLASCLAQYSINKYIQPTENDVRVSIIAANEAFGRHLNGIDITTGPIVDLSQPATNLTNDVAHSILLYGYSQLTADYSVASNLTPGKIINAITLTKSLCDDLASNGKLDGIGELGPLKIGSVDLSDQTLRLDLGLSVVNFIKSSSLNKSGFSVNDVLGLVNTVAGNVDTALFPSGLASNVIEFDAPTVQFIQPAGTNPVLSGAQQVQLLAEDAKNEVAEVLVDLYQVSPVINKLTTLIDTNANAEVFEAAFDTTSYLDGDYFFDVQATDNLGNSQHQTFDFSISNP